MECSFLCNAITLFASSSFSSFTFPNGIWEFHASLLFNFTFLLTRIPVPALLGRRDDKKSDSAKDFSAFSTGGYAASNLHQALTWVWIHVTEQLAAVCGIVVQDHPITHAPLATEVTYFELTSYQVKLSLMFSIFLKVRPLWWCSTIWALMIATNAIAT